MENKSETRITYGSDLFYPKRKTCSFGLGIEMRRAQPQAESFPHAPFRYVQRVPGSTIAHVSASPPFYPAVTGEY